MFGHGNNGEHRALTVNALDCLGAATATQGGEEDEETGLVFDARELGKALPVVHGQGMVAGGGNGTPYMHE